MRTRPKLWSAELKSAGEGGGARVVDLLKSPSRIPACLTRVLIPYGWDS